MCYKCFSRREWVRQESSKTSSLLFKRYPKNGKMGYYNNNLNIGVGVNTNFLTRQQQQQAKSEIMVTMRNSRNLKNYQTKTAFR